MKSTPFAYTPLTWSVIILMGGLLGIPITGNTQPCSSNCLLTSSFLGNTIYGFDAATYSVTGQSTNTGCGLSGTYDMDIGPDGNLYVVSSLSNQIFKYTSSGTCIGQFIGPGNGLSDPRGLLFMADGSLLVSCYDNGGTNGRILRYDGTTGAFIGNFSTGADVTPNSKYRTTHGYCIGA